MQNPNSRTPLYKHPLFWGLVIFVGLLLLGFGGGFFIIRFFFPH